MSREGWKTCALINSISGVPVVKQKTGSLVVFKLGPKVVFTRNQPDQSRGEHPVHESALCVLSERVRQVSGLSFCRGQVESV